MSKKIKFNKVNFAVIEDIEERFLKFILERRYKLPFFVFVTTAILVFSNAPYINLVMNSYLSIFIVILLAPLIIDINIAPLFIMAVALFVIAIIWWFIDPYGAEIIGNYIFIILFAGIVKALFSSGKI